MTNESRLTVAFAPCKACGKEFAYDLVGVKPATDIVCPECGEVHHLSRLRLQSIRRKFDKEAATYERLGRAEELKRACHAIDTAPMVKTARIMDMAPVKAMTEELEIYKLAKEGL